MLWILRSGIIGAFKILFYICHKHNLDMHLWIVNSTVLRFDKWKSQQSFLNDLTFISSGMSSSTQGGEANSDVSILGWHYSTSSPPFLLSPITAQPALWVVFMECVNECLYRTECGDFLFKILMPYQDARWPQLFLCQWQLCGVQFLLFTFVCYCFLVT